jgi:hypothetical protein
LHAATARAAATGNLAYLLRPGIALLG